MWLFAPSLIDDAVVRAKMCAICLEVSRPSRNHDGLMPRLSVNKITPLRLGIEAQFVRSRMITSFIMREIRGREGQ